MLANSTPLPPEAKVWIIIALLVMLLIGGVLIALILGRMLGPRGPWARSMGPPPGHGDRESDRLDPWQESAKRMQSESEQLDDLDEFDDEDEEPPARW